MHIFHNWTKWRVDKSEYIEEPIKHWDSFWEETRTHIRRFYRIHESRMCATCGRLEHRIRDCS